MIDALAAIVVDEANWLPFSMALALAAAIALLSRHRNLPIRRRVLAAMNLFFGMTIASMTLGHVLAVSIKLALGTLIGSPPRLYLIAVALALPSGWLVLHAWRTLPAVVEPGGRTLALNGWLAATLLALGLHNMPLAVPALFNAGYQLGARRSHPRAVGWTIVALAIASQVALFIGALVFLASGQSFEQFMGIE